MHSHRAFTSQKGKKLTPTARSMLLGREAGLLHRELTGSSRGSISTVLVDELSPLVPPTTNRALMRTTGLGGGGGGLMVGLGLGPGGQP